jgi:hypothetical protein
VYDKDVLEISGAAEPLGWKIAEYVLAPVAEADMGYKFVSCSCVLPARYLKDLHSFMP